MCRGLDIILMQRESVVETEQISAVETEQMSAVETGQMCAVETGQMSSVETGQVSSVETRQMSTVETVLSQQRKLDPEECGGVENRNLFDVFLEPSFEMAFGAKFGDFGSLWGPFWRPCSSLLGYTFCIDF